ncbi:MAG: epimerase [Acidimicrobiales bacterium]
MRALVVGGTGPTGPFIVDGLLSRGFEVAIFHRGTHEIPEIGPDVEHIHGDPHFPETIADALGDRTFDLVVATYGRIRFLAQHFVGRTGRFVSVGGFPVYKGFFDPFELSPPGMVVPVPEEGSVATEADNRFSSLIRQTELAVLDAHPTAAHFRYPYVYGPYQVSPREWSVVRRVLDQRPFVIVADGGQSLVTRGYAANLAHALLLAVDRPQPSSGQIYNCGDLEQYSVRQWAELLATAMGARIEVVSLPYELAAHGDSLLVDSEGFHRLMDLQKLRVELGYEDVVSVADGVAATVAWLDQHRPEPGGYVEEHIGDAFAYAAEDKLVDAYRRAMQDLVPMAPVRESGYRPHSYAHPKAPGQATDHRSR